jgi:hypothetical protein
MSSALLGLLQRLHRLRYPDPGIDQHIAVSKRIGLFTSVLRRHNCDSGVMFARTLTPDVKEMRL